MLCNMINGRCTHCGGIQGGRCRLSSPGEPTGDMTERLLRMMGIAQDERENIVSRFGAAPNCACQARTDWMISVAEAYGVKNIEKLTAANAKTTKSIERDKMHNQQRGEQKKLDQVVQELEKEGINLKNYKQKSAGLGDTLSSIFSKFGITEETVQAWGGIGGCGCDKRKKFLNQIIPFRKKA